SRPTGRTSYSLTGGSRRLDPPYTVAVENGLSRSHFFSFFSPAWRSASSFWKSSRSRTASRSLSIFMSFTSLEPAATALRSHAIALSASALDSFTPRSDWSLARVTAAVTAHLHAASYRLATSVRSNFSHISAVARQPAASLIFWK